MCTCANNTAKIERNDRLFKLTADATILRQTSLGIKSKNIVGRRRCWLFRRLNVGNQIEFSSTVYTRQSYFQFDIFVQY